MTQAFVAVLAIVGLLAIITPKPAVSDIENRTLAPLPAFSLASLQDGSFTEGLSVFYSDTFPLREQLIGVSSWLHHLFGLHGGDEVTLYRNTQATTEDAGDAEAVTDSNSEPEAFSMDPKAAGAGGFSDAPRDYRNSILVIGDTALSLFGTYEPALLGYVHAVNSFSERYADQLTTSVLVVPLYSEFRVPEQYKTAGDDQHAALSLLYTNIDDNVNKVQVYNTLAEHISEYLYFRTDHHWTALGAWYAYRAYAESLDMSAVPLSNYAEVRFDDFLGSLYSQIGGDALMAANPDYLIAYQPPWETTVTGYESADLTTATEGLSLLLSPEEVPGANKYMAFGYEYPYKKILTGNATDRRLIVFRESFANAMIPFLTEQYEEIHIIDFRYFAGDVDKIIRENGITDALFMNNMSSAGSDQHVAQIQALLGVEAR